MPLVRCKMYIYVKRIAIIAMKDSFLACKTYKTCKHAFCFRILRIDVIFQKTLYAINLYNFQENLFLFSRNFTIWIGLQLASQSDSFQALGSCFCEKYIYNCSGDSTELNSGRKKCRKENDTGDSEMVPK